MPESGRAKNVNDSNCQYDSSIVVLSQPLRGALLVAVGPCEAALSSEEARRMLSCRVVRRAINIAMCKLNPPCHLGRTPITQRHKQPSMNTELACRLSYMFCLSVYL